MACRAAPSPPPSSTTTSTRRNSRRWFAATATPRIPSPGASSPTRRPIPCNAYNDGFIAIQNDTPELGGFVHSQAAIVPASQFIADLPTGTHRPTVAYLGGLDGMLHAFYVPSDGLDLGYTGPAVQTGLPPNKPVPTYNPDASGTFAGHAPYAS